MFVKVVFRFHSGTFNFSRGDRHGSNLERNVMKEGGLISKQLEKSSVVIKSRPFDSA